MRRDTDASGFTGRHMLLIMLAFFGTVIAVNFTMAWFARSSWTGLVVENSYVASQQFNAKMAETRAQAALGWRGELHIADNAVRYRLSDSSGRTIPLDGVRVTFRRPVDDREDHTIVLAKAGDGFAADSAVADGVWLAVIEADAQLDKPYRETLRIRVAGGRIE